MTLKKGYRAGDKVQIGHWNYQIIAVMKRGYDANCLSTGQPCFIVFA